MKLAPSIVQHIRLWSDEYIEVSALVCWWLFRNTELLHEGSAALLTNSIISINAEIHNFMIHYYCECDHKEKKQIFSALV